MILTFAMLATPTVPDAPSVVLMEHDNIKLHVPVNSQNFDSKDAFLDWMHSMAERMWDTYVLARIGSGRP